MSTNKYINMLTAALMALTVVFTAVCNDKLHRMRNLLRFLQDRRNAGMRNYLTSIRSWRSELR